MTIKEEIIRLIRDLPDNVTIDDIINELYVRAKIEAGIKQLDKGQGIEHKAVKEKFGKWLS
jgi:hypothetical protein